MKKIFLISCTSRKRNYKCIAEEMYKLSVLFRVSLEYASKRVCDKNSQIFILSAKYGLLSLKDEINSYDESLTNKKNSECSEWGSMVYQQMKSIFDIENTQFIFLAGSKYIKSLEKYLNCDKCFNPIPIEKRQYGKRVKWLKESVEEK